ncbi:MAG: hypothetical protein JW786_04730 [Desulfobacterales bacterium]|nr:hypothetical protein [Desulfobacterales bacterium]
MASSDSNPKKLLPGDIWVISKGKYSDFDLSSIGDESKTDPVWEYRISELARYMLCPNPIVLKKKLIGCEVHKHMCISHQIFEKLKRLIPKNSKNKFKQNPIRPEVLLSGSKIISESLKDKHLESHIHNIQELLKPYDPIQKKLSELDPNHVSEIIGLCENVDGKHSLLNLRGSTEGKIHYIRSFILKNVDVIIERAHIANGLFEMGGFDFESYQTEKSYRVLKFFKDGKPRACVLNENNRVEYWIEDLKLLQHLHLLEQSLQTNSLLNDSFLLCTKGGAKPSKLFFNELNIEYSEANLPGIYRNVFRKYDIRVNEKNVLINSLKKSQFGIAFNYVPQSDSGGKKMFTHISVMHNLKALEPLKNYLPQLYAEINKKASVTEAGQYYLLDSITGCQNEQ